MPGRLKQGPPVSHHMARVLENTGVTLRAEGPARQSKGRGKAAQGWLRAGGAAVEVRRSPSVALSPQSQGTWSLSSWQGRWRALG